MEILYWAFFGLFALAHVVAPLLVRRSFWFSAQPGPHFARPEQFGDVLAAVLEERGAMIEALGFTHLAYASVPASMPDTTLHHRVLANDDRTVIAAVTVVVAAKRAPVAVTTFGSRAPIAEGGWREISTTDSTEYMALRPPGDVLTQRPEASAAELLATHREALAAQSTSDWVAMGSPIDAMREDLERVAEHGLASGLFVPDADVSGRHRLSVRGAYRMVWANLPPMTWLRRRGR